MESDSRTQRALSRAIELLLRPLCRLLLRHSVSFSAFAEMAKHVYVDIALKEFGVPGKKPTASRVAVLSGLTRKEVHRVLAEAAENGAEGYERYNRATRVLTGWARDAEFVDAAGKPRVLESDGAASFAALVKRYSGDMPIRAVLDELVRVGAVEVRDDGRLQLITPGFIPRHSAIDKLGILGRDVADLIATIDHNLQHGSEDPRFQRKVMYGAVPVAALPAFRKLSSAQAQTLLERLDRWLAKHEPAEPRDESSPDHARVGMGIYYFEERLDSSSIEGDRP